MIRGVTDYDPHAAFERDTGTSAMGICCVCRTIDSERKETEELLIKTLSAV